MSDQLKTESEMKSEKIKTKVEIEDLGPDMEEDIKTQDQSSENVNENSMEDHGSWILDLIDLSGLEMDGALTKRSKGNVKEKCQGVL